MIRGSSLSPLTYLHSIAPTTSAHIVSSKTPLLTSPPLPTRLPRICGRGSVLESVRPVACGPGVNFSCRSLSRQPRLHHVKLSLYDGWGRKDHMYVY